MKTAHNTHLWRRRRRLGQQRLAEAQDSAFPLPDILSCQHGVISLPQAALRLLLFGQPLAGLVALRHHLRPPHHLCQAVLLFFWSIPIGRRLFSTCRSTPAICWPRCAQRPHTSRAESLMRLVCVTAPQPKHELIQLTTATTTCLRQQPRP